MAASTKTVRPNTTNTITVNTSLATWVSAKLLELAVDVVLRGAKRGQVLECAGGLKLLDGRGAGLHVLGLLRRHDVGDALLDVL